MSDDPDTLTLLLAPGTVCVASLVQAHDPLTSVTLAQGWDQLQQPVFWGSLLAGLAIFGVGPWSPDSWLGLHRPAPGR